MNETLEEAKLMLNQNGAEIDWKWAAGSQQFELMKLTQILIQQKN